MINNDFDTPIMYQDLANYSMGPIITPFGGITNPYNTSLLRGTTMPRQLDTDKVEIMKQKENQDKSNFKKAALGLGLIIAAGFIPALRKGIKNGNLWESVKNAFKSSPKEPVMPKVKTWFGKRWESIKNFYNAQVTKSKENMPKVEKWFEDRWQGAKNIYNNQVTKSKNNMPKVKKWFGDRWQGVKDFYNNQVTKSKNNIPKVKTWFSNKWDGFKKLFKK